jgi:two-component system CheB/CheR fusion protein
LLGNAVKYTDPGGEIDIAVDHDGVHVEIKIRDTGIGLATADLETVFALYAQATQSAARPSAGGLGVGLHLAKIVVDAHGGSIRAMSDGLGCGSTFVLRLPCRAAASPAGAGESVMP